MGLKPRCNLFHAVDAEPVYQALVSFWEQRHSRLQAIAPAARDAYRLHGQRGGWALLDWDAGWEWTLRREAQLHVSRVLGCAGLLVFMYDGDYTA